MKIISNALFYTDCLILLERITAEQATLIYIDLPWSQKIEDIEFISKVLQQSRRILNEQGSIFFHLPSHIPPALRVIMDQIFGKHNFRSQIIWPTKVLLPNLYLRSKYEILLYYSKSEKPIFNPQFRSLTEKEIQEIYHQKDEKGLYRLVDMTSNLQHQSRQFEFLGFIPPSTRSWRYSKESLEKFFEDGKIAFKENSMPRLKKYYNNTTGVEIGDIWDDISNFIPISEPVEYFGQRPTSLLERIISITTNEGDLVLDPFCGSGTTMIAAYNLSRNWIGCDNNEVAYNVCQDRLKSVLTL
jgi:DNA modification methylase